MLRTLLGTMTATLAVGAAVQAAITRRDRRRYPPPGVLVNVGGHRLHLDVQGDDWGRPTVVLEAGMGSFSPNWHWVQRELAATTRVVAYDRAGLGWSDPSPRPRDAGTIADELHAALAAAGVTGPYVLAGHSFGGLPVRAFADRHPDEVVGLVLVDASHPDQWARWPTAHAERILATAQRVTAALAWIGLLRVIDVSAPIATGLPTRQVAELRARSALPRTSVTEARQVAAWGTSRIQVNAARPLGDLPLVVLSVTEQPRGGETLTQLQAELPALSTNSSHRTIQGAGHESLVAAYDHAQHVIRAITDVLASAERLTGPGSSPPPGDPATNSPRIPAPGPAG